MEVLRIDNTGVVRVSGIKGIGGFGLIEGVLVISWVVRGRLMRGFSFHLVFVQ